MLLVLSAPTGGGKTTLARKLVGEDQRLRFSVSHTTRALRPGERDGADYHFVTRDAFEAMRARGEFLECAEVHGNLYGTHRSQAESATREGRDLVLDIDVQGGLQVKAAWPHAVLVFILPPSLEELLRRLSGRSAEPGFDLRRRLESARSELALAGEYDYNVVNEDLERAAADVLCILKAARLRPSDAGESAALSRQVDGWLKGTDACSK